MNFKDFELMINTIDCYKNGSHAIDEDEIVTLSHTCHYADEKLHCEDYINFVLSVNGTNYEYWTHINYLDDLYCNEEAIKDIYDEIKEIIKYERKKFDTILSTFD